MSAETALPAGFEALEPFVESWSIAGSGARAQRRRESSEAERQAFYAAGSGLLAAALEHLDSQPVDALDPPEQRLMDLVLTLAHVVLAVEVQQEDEPRLAAASRHLRIVRAPADASGA